MRHHYTHEGRGAHFCAGTNCFGKVVTQLGDTSGEQLRISLTPAEARAYAAKLIASADKAETQPSLDELRVNESCAQNA